MTSSKIDCVDLTRESAPSLRSTDRSKRLRLNEGTFNGDDSGQTVVDLTGLDEEEDRKLPAKARDELLKVSVGAIVSSDDDDDVQVLDSLPTSKAAFATAKDDRAFAEALQAHEREQHAKFQQLVEKQMNESRAGKAWKFVECVRELCQTLNHPDISPVAIDDMVFMTERFMEAKDRFGDGPPVDCGYHYTLKANMGSIRTDGLMNKKEREEKKIESNFNGSSYGDGIYCASNPLAFRMAYGDVGLLVCRLRGTCSERSKKLHKGTNSVVIHPGTYREFVVLEHSCQCLPVIQFSSSFLGKSSQGTKAAKSKIYNLQVKVQALADAFFNNNVASSVEPAPSWVPKQKTPPLSPKTRSNKKTPGSRKLPPATAIASTSARKKAPPSTSAALSDARKKPPPATASASPRSQKKPPPPTAIALSTAKQKPPSGAILRKKPPPSRASSLGSSKTGGVVKVKNSSHPVLSTVMAPTSSDALESTEITKYKAPALFALPTKGTFSIVRAATKDLLRDECPLCLDEYGHHGKIVCMVPCGHHFHQSCIEDAMKHSALCPTCRSPSGKPQGKMPTGAMMVTRTTESCAGYSDVGTIVIKYVFRGGKQKTYHPNPGTRHRSAQRTTYLPDNDQGKALLLRLRYGFQHGLLFTVGTSLTTGQTNAVTWGSVHQKTSQSGGPYGFPDPNYFENCNRELDALRVPKADQLSSK